MLYVGLDVHSKQSSLCILNSAGGTVNEIQLKGPRSAVVDRLRQLDQPFSICYEASCGYGHLYESLRPLAAHVAVAHPGKLRLISNSKQKNGAALSPPEDTGRITALSSVAAGL
jgi:hypothetical protein